MGGDGIRPVGSISHTSVLYFSFLKCTSHVTQLSSWNALTSSEKKGHLDSCSQTYPPCKPPAS